MSTMFKSDENLPLIHWNRFAFDGSIHEFTQESKMKYLVDNSEMNIIGALVQARKNFQFGFAQNSGIFLITHDYEGELIPIDEPVDEKDTHVEFDYSRNLLDRNRGGDKR